MKRIGLARAPGDVLFEAVSQTGWVPVHRPFTTCAATGAPNPLPDAQLAVVLSPAAAKAVTWPTHQWCLATGTATAAWLERQGCRVEIAETPDGEGLWATLQRLMPNGGDILLVRGERSRGYLEQVALNTAWRFHPWITHREVATHPFPDLHDLDAVLALSPFQAEALAPHSEALARYAWGRRTAEAFARHGAPSAGWCDPHPDALKRMLTGAP